MELRLIEALLLAVQQGKRSDNGYKKEVWTDVLAAMHEAFPSVPFEVKQLKSKTDQLKKKYVALKPSDKTAALGGTRRNHSLPPPMTFGISISLYAFFID
jgi:hypothetical protein